MSEKYSVIIVALIGKSGSGKSTIENVIARNLSAFSPNEYFEYYNVAFASPLKRACRELFWWDYQTLNNGPRTKECSKWLDYDVHISPRTALQKMGDFMRNNIDQDFFCKFMKRSLCNVGFRSSVVCIQDMRFLNEYNFIKNLCAEKNWEFLPILIEREQSDESKLSAEQQNHISEKSLELIKRDNCTPIFYNNGLLSDLDRDIFNYIKSIRENKI